MRQSLIFHIASGEAFFSGVALIVLAVVLAHRHRNRWIRLGGSVASCTGLLLVVASATPLSGWFYAIAGVVTAVWFVVERTHRPRVERARPWLRGAVVTIWLLGAAFEAPYHLVPVLPVRGDVPVYVVGDSLAAGMGIEAVTWPKLLAREHGLRVRDLSLAGATVGTALKDQASRCTEPGTLVLAEIGGNDVLAGTAPAEFERSLDRLLARLRSDGRRVVLLELPLPPFYNRYGSIQRRLARKHGARLVPKRVLLGVLTTPGATVDTIHLSRHGHERMAQVLGAVLRPDARRSVVAE